MGLLVEEVAEAGEEVGHAVGLGEVVEVAAFTGEVEDSMVLMNLGCIPRVNGLGV